MIQNDASVGFWGIPLRISGFAFPVDLAFASCLLGHVCGNLENNFRQPFKEWWIIGRLGHHTTMSTDPFLSARCRVLVLHDESFLAGCILDRHSKDDQWDLFFFDQGQLGHMMKYVHMSFVKAEENPAVSGHD